MLQFMESESNVIWSFILRHEELRGRTIEKEIILLGRKKIILLGRKTNNNKKVKNGPNLIGMFP